MYLDASYSLKFVALNSVFYVCVYVQCSFHDKNLIERGCRVYTSFDFKVAHIMGILEIDEANSIRFVLICVSINHSQIYSMFPRKTGKKNKKI